MCFVLAHGDRPLSGAVRYGLRTNSTTMATTVTTTTKPASIAAPSRNDTRPSAFDMYPTMRAGTRRPRARSLAESLAHHRRMADLPTVTMVPRVRTVRAVPARPGSVSAYRGPRGVGRAQVAIEGPASGFAPPPHLGRSGGPHGGQLELAGLPRTCDGRTPRARRRGRRRRSRQSRGQCE